MTHYDILGLMSSPTVNPRIHTGFDDPGANGPQGPTGEPVKKTFRWSLRDICIEGDTASATRPTITATLDILGTPYTTASATELAVDLQNRLANRTPAPTLEISKVIFNAPATIVYWSDKTKTVVKCQEGDVFDPEKGLAMAIVKKMNGNTGKYCDIFKKWVPKEDAKEKRPICSLSFDTTYVHAALKQLKRTAEQSTMSVEEALNSIYGPLKKETGWISVKDRMPETVGAYLVCHHTGTVFTTGYNPDIEGTVRFWNEEITHWMPTPEPPVKNNEQKGE